MALADICRPMPNADGKFFPVSRELVFDIDLTDYDDVRTCGSGGHICTACWPLMAVAIKVSRLPCRCRWCWAPEMRHDCLTAQSVA